MKKVLYICLLIASVLFAKQTDVYFANGILTSKKEAEKNSRLLKNKINRPDVPNVYTAYNHTFDSHFVKGGPDLYESLLQKLSIMNKLDSWLSNDKRATAHKFDLDKQVGQYQNSIESEKNVLVVAHSQGNLFTNEVFEAIKDMGYADNFDAISVASPMFSDIKEDTVTYSWDNDLVADLSLNPLRKRYYCDARKVEWLKVAYYPKYKMPKHNYIHSKFLDKVYHGEWKAHESVVNMFDSNVHAFTFYMGESLKDGNTGEIFIDPFNEKEIKANYLKDKIIGKINEILDKNSAIGNGDNGGTTDPLKL